MKLNIDPAIAGRIKHAYAALSPDQQKHIAPLLAEAHQHALSFSQTGVAPPQDPAVKHDLLLAHSVLSDDQDGVLETLGAGVEVDVNAQGEIWGTGKYEQLDPCWTEAVAYWMEHLVLGKHAFPATAPNVISIPDSIQIGMAGDWGTGDWRTTANPAPSTRVRKAMANLELDLTIHLGDVYYAGTNDQEQNFLLDLWPAGPLGALALNSNHEMYPGGDAYFQKALAGSRFALQQQHSFFALENSNWVIVGLDSAYYSDEEKLYLDGALYSQGGPQVQLRFLQAQVAKGKQVIVLTHHNGLTQDGSATTTVWSQVMSAFPTGTGPDYWYWGHVHAGAVYQTTATTGNVRCRVNGHGGLPWALASDLANPNVAWYEKRLAHDPDVPERVLNGFAVLYLDGPNLTEVFYDENGGVGWP
ncbi:MAG TPA: metallophosphoesterase [Terriglobia bacterium]|nr:metallophosphoesterase [Terriglobia bacterium]